MPSSWGRLSPSSARPRADLAWKEPVTINEASEFILENLAWLLSLHAGRQVVPAGIWHSGKAFGYLPDLDRRLVSPLNRTVATQVSLSRYLQAAATAWDAADEHKKRTLRMAIAVRISEGQTELEVAIGITNFALEMLVEQLLAEPDTEDLGAAGASVSSYGLTNSQKKPIKAALEQAIRESVPADSDYARDIAAIKGRLFWRTAKDKIGRMLQHYGITFTESELGQFIKVRDTVVHGTPGEYSVEAKVKAMLFGQAMLTQSVLAELGWSGPTYDERQATLTHPSQTRHDADD